MKALCAIVALGLVTFVCTNANAQISYDESVDGALSTNHLMPTVLGSLATGPNTVSGVVANAMAPLNNGRNSDVFTFVVDPGYQLDSAVFTNHMGSNLSYAGLARGSVFPYDNAGLNALDANNNPYTGIGLIGFTDGTVLFDDNSNDFSNFATFYGSSGFTAPLGPDTYTFYVQETNQGGSPASYTLQLNASVTAIPEPSAFAILGAGGALAAMRRRRR